MAALTAVVVALSIAVATNFLLLLAVVRRLRLQRPAPPAFQLPTVGMRIPTFAVRGRDGQVIDNGFQGEHAEAVIAFFSDNCEPCQRAKEELAIAPIADPLLAFVQASAGEARQTDFADALAKTGALPVILDPQSDILGQFAVTAFPTLLRIRDGAIIASSVKLSDVRAQRSAQKSNGSGSHHNLAVSQLVK